MADFLITDGYFNGNFWVKGYFMYDFFPEYGIPVAGATLTVSTISWVYRTQMRNK